MRNLKELQTINGPVVMTEKILCNKCGGLLWEGKTGEHDPWPEYFEVEKRWGKNSKWGGQSHFFHLCQNCYANLTRNVLVPIDIVTE